MAVVADNQYGWVLDHKQCVDQQYIGTIDMFDPKTRCQHADSECIEPIHFKFKKDLFAVRHPFAMDSQFQAKFSNEHSGGRRERKVCLVP